MKRRLFLRSTMASGTIAVAAGAGLLHPRVVLAAAWPGAAFEAPDETGALRALFGELPAEASDAVRLIAPNQAADGASIPVQVASELPHIDAIVLTAAANPAPLCTLVHTPGAMGYYSTRIKLSASTAITAHVKAAGRLYTSTHHIKVSVGGYGMNTPEAADRPGDKP